MSVDAKHPDYTDRYDIWMKCRDVYEGADAVKSKTTLYLPATSGMVDDGMRSKYADGWKAYESYVKRAYFPDLYREAIRAMVGVMWHKDPVIKLPAAMEPLREHATLTGESLPMLLRKINEEQLIMGRVGLLADIPAAPMRTDTTVQALGKTSTPGDLPYLAMYLAEHITNWDYGRRDGIELQNLNLVILDETEAEREADFQWTYVEKYRVLVLGETDVNEPRGVGTYRVGVFRESNLDYSESAMTAPSFRGRTLDKIPFVFINSCDIVPKPDYPPLQGLSDIVLAIYRGEADYRQNLYQSGQDTLVVIGATDDDEVIRLGAGGRIDLPTGADAKFIGVSAIGLPEQRQSLENDYKRAAMKGAQMVDTGTREAESGEALTIRVTARTATLNQVALTGAYGLQTILRTVAEWIGANPEEVIVTPNLDFVENQFKPDDLVKLVTAKNSGAPLANETIHDWMQRVELTEFDFEEEMMKIDEEEPLGIGSSSPDDLPDDPKQGNST